MKESCLDILACGLLILLLVACSDSAKRGANWGGFDYVEMACTQHEASEAVCNPDDKEGFGMGRTKSAGRR